ncbi:helix-turn-helix transcriptional regulator [Raoultibacter phocaeensis]|uniref:helix-turn-helix transcriptional regulator n=1 Tax=Raoultibacter phocaeensis TaxID=2479841 RepID=UPI001117D290|nr:helix-turn-helix transcriptional regulator [Raoultibacter phocaeensis]
MGNLRAGYRWAGFDAVSLLSLAAFFASTPLLLAPLDLMRPVLASSSDGPLLEPLTSAPFLTAVALAAMFASLAMLFVCLLKTAYARLGRTLLVGAGTSYALGMLIVCAAHFAAPVPQLVAVSAGALVGAGGAVLCMAWARQVSLPDLRIALGSLVALGAAVFALDTLVLFMTVPFRAMALALLAVAGMLGCVRSAWGSAGAGLDATTSGANWWDVFGRLDMSLIESGSDFATPLSRTLFFIVTPAVVFLLFIAGMNMHHTFYGDVLVEVLGGSIAVLCAIVLLFMKTERATINVAYRIYLPLIAAVVFVVGDFAPLDVRGLFLNVGVYVFCFVYGLVMCAMVIMMMSRMRSLALPAACMLVIAACLIAMPSYANLDAGVLGAYRLNVLLVLLLVAVILLIVTPSSRVWRLVIEGIDLSDALEKPGEQAGRSATLEERCDYVARACGLTPRESEILRFLGRGYGSVYIAEALVIAESTVRSHVKSIYRKVDVSSREELISRIDEIGETPETDAAPR